MNKTINKTIKRIGILLALVLSMGLLVSCNNPVQDAEVEDTNVEDVNVEDTNVEDAEADDAQVEDAPRIVSVSPSVTELIFDFGKEGQLVGRSEYCDYPAEVEDIPSVGSLLDPNVEKIIELEPDILLVSAHFKDEVTKVLEDAGIEATVIYNAEDFEGSFEVIKEIGEILDAEEEADRLVANLEKEIEDIREKVADEEKPTVYYVVGFGKNGDYTATGDTYIAEILKAAGGTNIAEDGTEWKYSLEKIIENDPEYILISKDHGMKEEFIQTEGYKDLSAVKNNKVIEIDDDLLNRQGPRLAQGVESIAKVLHPDLFE